MVFPTMIIYSYIWYELVLSQVGILGIQFIWTRDAEIALSNARSDRKIMGATDQVFLDMLNALIDVTTQNLTKIVRRKFETLITIHLHQRDIFHDLVSDIHLRDPTPWPCCIFLHTTECKPPSAVCM